MKIQSNFKDYYDNVLVYGTDAELIYKRFTTVIHEIPSEVIEFINTIPKGSIHYSSRKSLVPRVLGFAGKLYPLWEFENDPKNIIENGWEHGTVFYNSDSILKGLYTELAEVDSKYATMPAIGASHKKYLSLAISSFLTIPSYNWKSLDDPSSGYPSSPRKHKIDKFLESNFGKKVSDSIFQDLGVPVFLVIPTSRYGAREKNQLILNPKLENIGVPQFIDSYTAYQELSMYVGGVLTTEKEIVKITDDKILAAKHGYDKHSFRQVAPGEKKARRKLNRERKKK